MKIKILLKTLNNFLNLINFLLLKSHQIKNSFMIDAKILKIKKLKDLIKL